MKRSFADILQDLEDGRTRKLARKLPDWAAAGVEVPGALALEQCSSSATAAYKAKLVRPAFRPDTDGPLRHGRILDLTGGLGVDARALAGVARELVYFERDAELAEAARRNFARLGAANIEVRCETVTPETELPEADLIYADPARRDAAGRKVFRLEDCSPDILPLLPLLLRKAPAVLLKLSPMADLAMLAQRLSPALREIHGVESGSEVKEILCLLHAPRPRSGPASAIPTSSLPAACGTEDAEEDPEPQIFAVRLHPRRSETQAGTVPDAFCGVTARLTFAEERAAAPVFAPEVRAGDTLLEPAPALLKSGAFNLPCARWGLFKLAPSTHLYIAPAGTVPDDAAPFFKALRIREVLPFGNAALRQAGQRWPRAEVTARDLPVTSEALQKKRGISPGGDTHIFACRRADGSAVLIVATRTI